MIGALLFAVGQADPGRHSADEVSAALQRVIVRRGGPGESPAGRLAAWFLKHLGGEGGVVGEVLLWTFLALVAFALARFTFGFVRRIIGPRGEGRLEGAAGPDAMERARELLARSREERSAGEYRSALGLSLLALVLALGGRGALEFQPAWTFRELLVRGRPRPGARRLLELLVSDLEAKEFGEDRIDERDLDRVESLCVRAIGGDL
ncbi:MAG TPA: hypothetical protein ENJ09_13160 [Planctomycetes bacterium]|nr:hypothetical protein [Planctomycetota bacterium]